MKFGCNGSAPLKVRKAVKANRYGNVHKTIKIVAKSLNVLKNLGILTNIVMGHQALTVSYLFHILHVRVVDFYRVDYDWSSTSCTL